MKWWGQFLRVSILLVVAVLNSRGEGEDIATTFTYTDAAAKSVGIAGEFSNWKVVPLDKVDGGVWAKKIYLKPGFYGYKFVVNDADWVLDPSNPAKKIVNEIENSGIAVGGVQPTPTGENATTFSFKSPDAQTVHLAGDFNNWLDNEQGKVTGHEQWMLKKDDSGVWKLSASLNPGKHEFKYVVDGGAKWETDPSLPVSTTGNSLIEIAGGGATFTLDDATAKSVAVAGEFNDWSTSANPLAKDASGKWTTNIQLKPGKYQYKFVVDGNWKPDPANKETAPDGLGGENSVKTVP